MKIRAESAFDFKHAFDAQGNPIKLDWERVWQTAGILPKINWLDMVELTENHLL